jgi:transposase
MRGEKISIKNYEEIEGLIKREKDPRIKQKLSFLYIVGGNGLGFSKAVEAVGIDLSTGYKWVKRWNNEGYEGLLPSKNKGGRPPKLSKDDLKDLREILKSKDYWTTKEVKVIIKEVFDKELSEDQVRRILRDKLKMRLSKPYPHDYRRPENADRILKERIEENMKELEEKGYKPEEIAIGFIDESSPQSTANTVRVWSFGKPNIKKTQRG